MSNEKQVLAQLGHLRGRVEIAIAELTDIADIIGATARMIASSQKEESRE